MKLNKSPQEILEENGIPYKGTTSSLMIQCPSCLKDKKKRAVRRTNGGNLCYVCGAKSSFQALLQVLLGLTEEQVKLRYGYAAKADQVIKDEFDSILADLNEIISPKEEEEEEIKTLPEVLLDSLFIPIEESVAGMEYLIKRGVKSPKIWIDYDIHYNGIMGGPVFPIKMYGKVVGWQCRKINPTKGGPRMLSMPGEWKSQSLLNYDNALKAEEIAVFEGPFDALAAEMSGLVSVATLGKIVSRRQIQLLKETKAKVIYLGFDRDAYKEVEEFCVQMCRYKKVYRLAIPSHRDDIGECTPEEIQEAKDNAEELFGYRASVLDFYLD